jgi:hypothetical protein
MAALKPAACAFLTLSSKLHPPLTINTNGGQVALTVESTLLKGEHASKGSAKYNEPHSPDPFNAGAKLASMSSNDKVSLLPINTTLPRATQAIRERKLQTSTSRLTISDSIRQYQIQNNHTRKYRCLN